MIFWTLFYEFFLIGLFTFGGGYAMIPLVRDLVVNKYEWLSASDFINLLGVCESTPGPIAINMATYVGSTQGGVFGSIVATLGVISPSFIIILLIAIILKKFMNNRFLQGFFSGVKPIVFALILSSALILLNDIFFGFSYDLTSNSVSYSISYRPFLIALFLLSFVLLTKKAFNKKVNVIYVIVLGAIIGISVNYCFLEVEEASNQIASLSTSIYSSISTLTSLYF